MIPRRFFWLFDLIVLSCAFAVAYWLTPYLGPFFHGTGLATLSSVLDIPSTWRGQLPPLSESVWILLVMSLPGLMVVSLAGGHRPLLGLPLTRIIISSVLAVFTGLSMIALIMFALKSPGWS